MCRRACTTGGRGHCCGAIQVEEQAFRISLEKRMKLTMLTHRRYLKFLHIEAFGDEGVGSREFEVCRNCTFHRLQYQHTLLPVRHGSLTSCMNSSLTLTRLCSVP